MLCDEPRIQPSDVSDTILCDLLPVAKVTFVAVVQVLDDLSTTDVLLAEVSQEVPQAELQGDLVRVRIGTQVLRD
jgi:hypothetical protein